MRVVVVVCVLVGVAFAGCSSRAPAVTHVQCVCTQDFGPYNATADRCASGSSSNVSGFGFACENRTVQE